MKIRSMTCFCRELTTLYEALAKALGAPGGLAWHDAEVVSLPSGQPTLELRGTVLARAQELGVTRSHLSLTHDGGVAIAFLTLE